MKTSSETESAPTLIINGRKLQELLQTTFLWDIWL